MKRSRPTSGKEPPQKRARRSPQNSGSPPRVSFAQIIALSQLLSHASREATLREVVKKLETSASASGLTESSSSTSPSNVFSVLLARGKLEKHIPPEQLSTLKTMLVVPHFRHLLDLLPPAVMISTPANPTMLQLLSTHVPAPLPSSAPPGRTLAGVITSRSQQHYDVVLCRDKSTKMTGMSILLTEGNGDRKKGRKVGYLLAGVEPDGSLALRGLHIAEHFRGCGLSKLLLSTWLLLCYKLGTNPCTKRMDKPLLALTLTSSFGFVPASTQWPVHVGAPIPSSSGNDAVDNAGGTAGGAAGGAAGGTAGGTAGGAGIGGTSTSSASHQDKGRSRLWSTNNNRLRSIFSKNVCKTQRIEIVDVKPIESRTTYVHTTFQAPLNLSEQVQQILGTIEHTWYSSKVIAFASEFVALKQVIEKQMV